ncbi:chromosome segregation protein SMC [Azovibrio restrictus]|uniref:chromosome segregation protein SMC n=1 Tax=Azovibrio restrictus TaxID=146938 RepID=UPI00040C9B4B|nr:chromosome segregation protein SMC [Azovibrio restrictus]
MRLTKLKLAGFKSFVDPTTVALPGQLVGVVGPNGCGKSNIMDAVRWVLGESKASELRGESMQDVIFNGSTNRKPVARASVELIFDNALGRALGQWSQYAELAVKRVLTRNGQSDYFINNLKVRRKDITDLFLGTGLGPRAYAIIGQGMISRIIEARPDDLRVFLEEAAGVSRYKERRKETEGRLEDTRENLTRVEDIRLELGAQMEKLEGQAEVARQYHHYNDTLVRKQQVLWILRRNDARAEAQRLSLEVERASTELEGATAGLRETEARLEEARETHFAAGDGVHQAQSELFAANAEVARLEAEIRHRKESRRQLESRLVQLEGEQQHWETQAARLASDRTDWEARQEEAELRLEQAQAKGEMLAERLPLAEEQQARAQAEVDRLRRDMSQLEQHLQVELTHQAHAQRSLQSLAQRRERLRQELEQQEAPDTTTLETRQAELLMQQELQAEAHERLQTLQERLPDLEQRRRELQEGLQQAQREVAAAESRRSTLEQMQARVQHSGKLPEWLKQHGLAEARPLWQQLQVEPGWESAVEAVLRERLSALAAPSAEAAAGWAQDRPGVKLTLRLPGSAAPQAAASDSLLARLRVDDPAWEPLLADWFARVLTAASLPEALARRETLPPGCCCVTPGGDLVERHGLTLFAPDKAEHGLLERQREIETLGGSIEAFRLRAEACREELAALEDEVAQLQASLQQLRREQGEAQGRIHALQVETLKLSQALERHREQQARISEQLAELEAEEESERERQYTAEELVAQLREQVEGLREQEQDARAGLEAAERALRDERERAAAGDREVREAQFSQRECAAKLQEIFANQALAQRQLQRIGSDLAEGRAQALDTPPEVYEEQLQLALENRREQELQLAGRRDALESATQALRALEEQRLRIEQGLEPLRSRIGELKLKEQAAALNAEQLAGQLLEAGSDESLLQEELQQARPQALAQEIGRLQKAIAELGAVNLAALQELETARERKGYLDDQAADLVEAMETLENAIRRIDRETRDLLQNTFDTVNGHFGRLFPELFGGGRAELVMTGDEILDAGVQVVAQPPGKKNSSIHLLSGGEKALTAIALVFSMFQLNPAPFCLLDEVDAPLDDTNTERFCQMVQKMSGQTQFLFISHNKIAMEMAEQLVGVTMQESGVSRVVEVDMEAALKMRDAA